MRVRTRGAIDQAKDRISAGARREALCNVSCAHAPAILRLVAGEAGSPIRSEVLEKGVVEGERRPLGLKCCDCTGRIRLCGKARNDGRGRLRTFVGVFEATHQLHVLDHIRRERRYFFGPGNLHAPPHTEASDTSKNEKLQSPDRMTLAEMLWHGRMVSPRMCYVRSRQLIANVDDIGEKAIQNFTELGLPADGTRAAANYAGPRHIPPQLRNHSKAAPKTKTI